MLPKVYAVLQMEARRYPEKPGFAALMKEFLRTDPYKCILCGNRLHFISAQAGRHVTELVTERLHSIDRKRWLLAQIKGQVRLKNGFQVKNASKLVFYRHKWH